MNKILRNSLLSLFLLTLFLSPFKAHATENIYGEEIPFSKAICDFKMEQRKLWIEHVLWTRNFIISDISSLEDKSTVLERLLKNQDDIGNSIKPYYGEKAGNKLASLLREHISIAGQVVNAAKTNNKADFEKYNELWYKNVDEISDFLSSINPNYSNKNLKDLFHKHLQMITDEVVARLKKDWKGNVEAFDKGENHIIKLADAISDGIIRQFPNKFK